MINFKHLNSGVVLSNLNKSKEGSLQQPGVELDNNVFHLPNEEELDHSAK